MDLRPRQRNLRSEFHNRSPILTYITAAPACGLGRNDILKLGLIRHAEAVSFQLIVTDLDGNETTFKYTSNAATGIGDTPITADAIYSLTLTKGDM